MLIESSYLLPARILNGFCALPFFAPLGWIIALAFTIEAIAGFGSTVFTLTLGSATRTIPELIAILIPLNLFMGTWICLNYRKKIPFRFLLTRVLPIMFLGYLPGIIGSFVMSPLWLRQLLGACLILLSAFEVFKFVVQPPAPGLRRECLFDWFLLLLGGFVQGILASGGPVLVYYISRKIKDKTAFRSSLSFLWMVFNCLTVTIFFIKGRITSETFGNSLNYFPWVILGLAVGSWLHHRIPEKPFRVLIFVLLGAAGLSFLGGP